MTIITKRNLWDELKNPLVPRATTLDAITGQSLRIDMFPPEGVSDGTVWAMVPGSNLIALFPDEKVQCTWAVKVEGSATVQSITIIRMGPDIILGSNSEWGLLAIVGDFGGDSVLVARFVNSVFDLLGIIALPSRNEVLRATSDDNGSNVRFKVERWNGTSFDSLYFGEFADMAPMLGDIMFPAVFIAGYDQQGSDPIAGDIIVLDDILIDSAAVIPP